MGAGASAKQMKGTETEIINLMMPLYYIAESNVTVRDTTTCMSVWNAILDDATPQYILTKDKPGFTFPSCRVWFYNVFYDRLFDIHPLSKPLFTNGVDSIGTFLVKMISMSLNQCDDKPKFHKAMVELAERHCERGVKAVEYGIVGDVLFYTLEITAGALYTPPVEACWKKVFSSMLAIIVPLVVGYERKGLVKRTGPREASESKDHHVPNTGLK